MKTMIAALGLMAGASATAAELPSVEHFMRHATYSSARISPDGQYLAIGVDRGGQDVLTVLRLSDLSLVKVNVLPDDKSVAGYRWVGDNRLIFTAIRKVGSFAQPFGTGEWYSVNADGSQPRPVIFYGSRGAAERSKEAGNARFSLLDPLEDDARNVLMTQSTRRGAESSNTELVMVDTVSGNRRTIAKAPRENCQIEVDHEKQPRFALCYDQQDAQGRYDPRSVLYRLGDDGKWSQIGGGEGGKELMVQWVAKDGSIYGMQDDGKAPAAFGEIDRATGEFRKLFQDPVAEVSNIIISPTDEKPLAVVTEAGVPRITMIDESHPDAELYGSLAAAFPGQVVNFSSATRDGKQVIVSVYSDRNPGELYLYDRGTGKARFLMKSREWVDAEESATMRAFSLKTRDGLTIYGYLTIPKGADPKNLPLIVNPHGGPMGPRDNWGYNPETQLFASRGYATLQVNFRGSGGYGKAFQDMAYGQWHTGIMNDIIDATRWAIDQGIADPNRVCIYGGSFGGYSALMAPARARPVQVRGGLRGHVRRPDPDAPERHQRQRQRPALPRARLRQDPCRAGRDVADQPRRQDHAAGVPGRRRPRSALPAGAHREDVRGAGGGGQQAGGDDHPVRRDARLLRRAQPREPVLEDAGLHRQPHRRQGRSRRHRTRRPLTRGRGSDSY